MFDFLLWFYIVGFTWFGFASTHRGFKTNSWFTVFIGFVFAVIWPISLGVIIYHMIKLYNSEV